MPFGTGIWGEPDLALPARGALGEPLNVSLETAGSSGRLPNLYDVRYGAGRASSTVLRLGLGVAFGFVPGLSVLMAAASRVLLMWAA